MEYSTISTNSMTACRSTTWRSIAGTLLIAASGILAADGDHRQGPHLGWEARPPFHRADAFLYRAPVGYSPGQIRHAYGVDRLAANGAGQVIAIVEAYGSSTIANDLSLFSQTFRLPPAVLKIVYPQGKPLSSSASASWALETSLDVEWAHALAPGATILLVVSKSSGFYDLLGAVDYAVSAGATVVSMSWGAAEFSGVASYDSHFNHPGVTFTASSGDNGAAVEWPAVSPFVVGVGGTSLYLDAQGNRTAPEAAWSGSGGGISQYEGVPGFQLGWQTGSGRGVPDVALVADPNTGVAVYIGNYAGQKGWINVGGTSAGAPMWAALIALANQGRAAGPLSAANPVVYAQAMGPVNSTLNLYTLNSLTFFDVSQGSNGSYTAALPYDYVVGLGTPVAANLIPGLATH